MSLPPRLPRVVAAWLGALLVSPVSAQSAGGADGLDDAPGRPKWEAGVVAGAASISDYPGADQSQGRRLVAPVFLYRGPIVRVDAAGIRGRLFNSPHWQLDLSATAAFNTRNNDAREGMPDLDYLFGVGPQIVYKGWQRGRAGPTLHLKTRAVMSTDFRRIDRRGATFDAELRWRVSAPRVAPATLTLWVQPTWATQALHRHFYEVDAAQATPARPAYEARAGYLGTEVGLNLSRRHGDSFLWFATARALSLHGSANAASPLLRDKSNFSVGLGVMWTPWRSAVRVAH